MCACMILGKSWSVYSLVIYPLYERFWHDTKTGEATSSIITRPSTPAMLPTAENSRGGGNDRRGEFYAADWSGSSEHTEFVLSGGGVDFSY